MMPVMLHTACVRTDGETTGAHTLYQGKKV